MSSALMLVSDGFEEVEALTAVDILRRAGANVTIMSITGSDALHGSHRITVKADDVIDKNYLSLSEKYDAVILPGGLPNAHTLRDDTRVGDIVKDFYNKNKIVAAICAAPCVLEKNGLLAGKKATSYPGCIDETKCDYKGTAWHLTVI